jgi:hypothetical protein
MIRSCRQRFGCSCMGIGRHQAPSGHPSLTHRKELFFAMGTRSIALLDCPDNVCVLHHSVNLFPCWIVPCHTGDADEKRSSFIGRNAHRRVQRDGAGEWGAGIKGALLQKKKGHRDYDNCGGNKQRSTGWEYMPPLRQNRMIRFVFCHFLSRWPIHTPMAAYRSPSERMGCLKGERRRFSDGFQVKYFPEGQYHHFFDGADTIESSTP